MSNKKLYLVLLISVLFLNGCDKKPVGINGNSSANETTTGEKPDPKQQLLKDISGVWRFESNRGLLTLNYENNQMQTLIDDYPLAMEIGDVDPENNTVNLLGTRKDNNEKLIWTVKKLNNPDNNSYRLDLTLQDGNSDNLSFVRKITSDDKMRINRAIDNSIKEAVEERDAQKKADALAAKEEALAAKLAKEEEKQRLAAATSTSESTESIPEQEKAETDAAEAAAPATY